MGGPVVVLCEDYRYSFGLHNSSPLFRLILPRNSIPDPFSFVKAQKGLRHPTVSGGDPARRPGEHAVRPPGGSGPVDIAKNILYDFVSAILRLEKNE